MEKNTELLNKALHLLPEVRKTKIVPLKGQSFFEPLGKDGMVEIDFGRHMVGYLHLKLGYINSHPDAPVWLKIYFAESKKELEEKVENYDGWICSGWVQQEQIHVDVIPAEIELPRRYAFRYVKIEVLDISSKFELTIDDAYVEAVSSADETTLIPYESTDKELVAIDRIACNTLHDCMQQVFEDGPKRDRRLWIGDLRLQALANYETYRMNDMVKGCLYLFAALPMEKGRMGACLFLSPEPEVDDTQMFDYSLFFINTLWDYYEATKDKETLQELWPVALRQIELAEEQLDEKMLVGDSDVLGWCFVDWNLNLNKQASAQGIFLYALSAAIRIAQVLGDVMTEEKLAELYCECRNAANLYLWDGEKQCYISGKERQVSVASQVWMILGEAIEDQAAVNLLRRVETISEAEKMVTPYMYHNYIAALLLVGEKKMALQKMEAYWGGMTDLGADTFWELYNPENPSESPYGGTIVNSYCHAWSCGPAYFLRKYFTADGSLKGEK